MQINSMHSESAGVWVPVPCSSANEMAPCDAHPRVERTSKRRLSSIKDRDKVHLDLVIVDG